MEPEKHDWELRELRRGYHDRIADLRDRSLSVLRFAAQGTEEATRALVAGDAGGAEALVRRAQEATGVAAEVDDEVVALLALESPVARDLRVILAARDVTQISLLCVGLTVTIAKRSGALDRIPSMRDEVALAGSRSSALLHMADAAWATLDTVTAGRVRVK